MHNRHSHPRSTTPPASGDQRRATREPGPADWAYLWEQPGLRPALSARDIGAISTALTQAGVSQRRIAQQTGQAQPEISAILNKAEAFAARVSGGGQNRPVGVLAGVLRATIHVRTGEPRGLAMADEVIRAVAPLRSVRTRQKLDRLVQALESHPGSDARDLARTARKVAA